MEAMVITSGSAPTENSVAASNTPSTSISFLDNSGHSGDSQANSDVFSCGEGTSGQRLKHGDDVAHTRSTTQPIFFGSKLADFLIERGEAVAHLSALNRQKAGPPIQRPTGQKELSLVFEHMIGLAGM